MTLRLFDHHIHSTWSDGAVTLAGRAKTVAVRPHGVSDHYPWRDKLPDEDAVKRYIDDAAKHGLRVGLEYDLGVAPPLSRATHDALHYVIGAMHSIRIDGTLISYDDAGAYVKGRLKKFPRRELFADPELQRKILARTLEVVEEGITRDRIDILGHPTFSALQALDDPERVYPEEWQRRLIDLCVRGGIAIELNESYGVPHREFLVRAAAMGATFSVGSDTHFEIKPLDATEAMIEAAALAHDRFMDGRREGAAAR